MTSPNAQTESMTQAECSRRRNSLAAALGTGMWAFHGIALASIVNSFLFRAGENYGIIGGLGSTQLIDVFSVSIARGLHAEGNLLYPLCAGTLNALLVAFLILAGLLGARAHRPAIALGMLLIAADEAVLVWAQDWSTAVLHGFALWFLWNSLIAAKRLLALPAPARPEPAAEVLSPAPVDPRWSSDGETARKTAA